MLRLRMINKPRAFKVGEVVHLKVRKISEPRAGWWELEVDDVTPLPGSEPPGYACWSCGIIEPVKEDGGLPDGWTMKEYGDGSKKYPKGHHFFCDAEWCQKDPMCRLCGCNNDHACDPPCSWIEPDRCSGCEA
jgi:hypothetical protein